MIYCVALTGNIASGKSTAMALFKSLRVPVISADQIAKDLTQKGSPAYLAIVDQWGQRVVMETGNLNRAVLRRRITYHADERRWLEDLLHPLIQETIEKQVIALDNKAYCVVEVPLLVSLDAYPYVNRVLVLLSPKRTQIERLMERDNLTYDEAADLVAIQPSERTRRALADDLILNTGTVEALKVEIIKLHENYIYNAGVFG